MPHGLTRQDGRVCLADRRKGVYCILAAVFFTVGILGNLFLGDAGGLAERWYAAGSEPADCGAVWSDAGQEAELSGVWEAAVPGTVVQNRTTGGIAACRMLQGFDDFQITSDSGSVGQNALQGARAVVLLLFAETVRRLFGGLAARRRLWNERKQICRFYVVQFIHQTDGKKKACFA